ncbi:MAG: WD40 repeat domain-containing protein, partial [Gemmataceae bacterium]|nr:WD40 repeat domain-containing protein [Gemmataceae bacterium]
GCSADATCPRRYERKARPMQVLDLPIPDATPDAVCFAPDGRALAAVCRGRVFVLDAATGTARVVVPDADEQFAGRHGAAFTADGRAVVVHHSLYPTSVVEVHDLETGQVLRDLALRFSDPCDPEPGGRLVYAAVQPERSRHEVEIVRWDPLTGARLPGFARQRSGLQQLAVSADQAWVAGSGGSQVRLWNLGGNRRPERATKVFTLEYALVVVLAIAGDGGFVAAGTFENLVNHNGAVRVLDRATGEVWVASPRDRENERHGVGARDLAFHPSRPLLAFRGETGEAVFYDCAARAELKRFAWDVGPLTALSFSQDGLRCAAGATGKVVVWDVDV